MFVIVTGMVVPTAAVSVSAGAAFSDLDRPRFLVAASARLVLLSRLAAALAAAIGFLVLVGYQARSTALVQLYPSLPPMYPNAAIAFVVGGVAAVSAARPGRMIRWLAGLGFLAIAMYGVVTIGLHIAVTGGTWLEGLWPSDSFVTASTRVPGRPVAETCVGLVCIGTAGVLMTSRRLPRLMQGLALGTISVGAAAVIGFIIGVDRRSLGSSFVIVGMALHTAVALMLLGVAVSFAQPTTGLMARLTRSGATAQLGRRLVAAVVIAPIVLTTGSALMLRFVPDAKLALSIAAVLQVVALGMLVLYPLRAAERVEERAVDELREARRIIEQVGEREVVFDAITTELLQIPESPPGWKLGYRQAAAHASMPGDSCQVLIRHDQAALVCLVDVAGHGSESALHAFRLRAQLSLLWRAGHSLGEVSSLINRSVIEMNTIATGVLVSVAADGNCEYINAGHPAVLCLEHGKWREWSATTPLFGVEWKNSHASSVSLGRPTRIIGYTDGVTEARDEQRAFLGDASVRRAVQLHQTAGPQAVADAIFDAALAHSYRRLRDDALVFVLSKA